MSNFLFGVAELSRPMPQESDLRGGLAHEIAREASAVGFGSLVDSNVPTFLLRDVKAYLGDGSHEMPFLITDHPGTPFADHLLSEYDQFINDKGVTVDEPPLRDRMSKIQKIIRAIMKHSDVGSVRVMTFQGFPSKPLSPMEVTVEDFPASIVSAFEQEENVPELLLRIGRANKGSK